MPLSRDAAIAALDSRPGSGRGGTGDHSGPRSRRTTEETKARRTAMALAQADARSTLAQLHHDEYRALYEVAVERRLAAIGQTR